MLKKKATHWSPGHEPGHAVLGLAFSWVSFSPLSACGPHFSLAAIQALSVSLHFSLAGLFFLATSQPLLSPPLPVRTTGRFTSLLGTVAVGWSVLLTDLCCGLEICLPWSSIYTRYPLKDCVCQITMNDCVRGKIRFILCIKWFQRKHYLTFFSSIQYGCQTM